MSSTHLTPPHRPDLEEAILGALLLAPEAIADVADVVSAADFYLRRHRLIFRALMDLDSAGERADVVTIADRLREQGHLEEVGGREALVCLARDSTGAANIRAYAERVRDAATERQLLQQLYRALQTMGEAGETSEKINRVQQMIMDVGRRSTEGPRQIGALLPVFVDQLDRRSQSGDLPGLATGFADLDRQTSGLQAGDLVIVAARPSMGKTALGMNIAEYVAQQGVPVLVFSLEMPDQQLLQRSASSLSGVRLERIRRPSMMQDDDWPRLSAAMAQLRDAPLYIDDSAALSPTEMRARARRIMQRHGLGLIVVDYLQLMQVPGFKENRTAEISEISRSLKGMAKELGVPVIALSQLNRSLEQRPDRRPVMSDLRESGAIEQDADLILLVYRDEYYREASHADPRRGIAEVVIAKHRNGPTGRILLRFEAECVRFADLDEVSGQRYISAVDQPTRRQRRPASGFDAI